MDKEVVSSRSYLLEENAALHQKLGLHHMRCIPSVEGDFLDVVFLSQFLDKFLDKAVEDYNAFSGLDITFQASTSTVNRL